LFFGAITGAVVGLPLGLLDGLLLSWLATAYRNAPRLNSRRYQLQARIVCVVGSLLALLIDWSLHGLPDPDGFVVYRANVLVQDLFLPVSDAGGGASPAAITLGALGILVFPPMLMILFASWLTGRFVAGWYAGRVYPPRPPGHGA
jgi:hypothetical protein